MPAKCEILPPEGPRVWVRTNPLSQGPTYAFTAEGGTVADIFGLDALDLGQISQRDQVAIYVGGHKVAPELWRVVRPKAGSDVLVYVKPQGKKKAVLGIVLSIAALAASFYLGPALGTALLGAEGTFLGLSAAQFGGLLIGLVSSILIRAFVRPTTPTSETSGAVGSNVPTITGSANRANPYGAVPLVQGDVIFYPPVAAVPYNEIIGNDQYYVQLFAWEGPCWISRTRIGNTPVSDFEDVEIEVREGFKTDPPRTLYRRSVAEVALGIQLKKDEPHVRTAASSGDRLTILLTMPTGNFYVPTSGSIIPRFADVRVEYRLRGLFGPWVAVPDPASNPPPSKEKPAPADRIYVPGGQERRRWALTWDVPAGLYEVRVTKLNRDPEDFGKKAFKHIEEVFWASIQSSSPEDPLNLPGCASVAIRIKASEQLSGRIESFNCRVRSLGPIWSPIAGGIWLSDQPSRNPAWAFALSLTHPSRERPVALADLDGPALAAWADLCDQRRLKFDKVQERKRGMRQELDEICNAGLALYARPDGRHLAIPDEPRSLVTQVYTPANSRSFRAKKVFHQQPHALKVRYVDRVDGNEKERIVYDDGYDAGNASLFEVLRVAGTDARGAFIHGRFRLAEGRLRPQLYTIEVDFENLINTRGDLVLLNHDVALFGLGYGRVLTVTIDGGGNMTGFQLDGLVPQETSKSYQFKFRLADGSVVLADVANNGEGEWDSFTFTPAIANGQPQPAVGDLAIYGEWGKTDIEAIVLDIQPASELAARLTLTDAGNGIFDSFKGEIPDYDPGTTAPPDKYFDRQAPPPPAIDTIASDESTMVVTPGGSRQARIMVFLVPYQGAEVAPAQYSSQWRRAGDPATSENGQDPWRDGPTIDATTLVLVFDQVEDGEKYDIRIRSISAQGVASERWRWIRNYEVVGRRNPPPDPQTLTLAGTVLSWTYGGDVDDGADGGEVDPGGIPADHAGFELRVASGQTREWTRGSKVQDTLITDQFIDVGDNLNGTRSWMVKAVDTAGNQSLNPAVLITGLGDAPVDNVVEVTEQAPDWAGTITNGEVVGGVLRSLSTTTYWRADPIYAYWTADPAWMHWAVQYEQLTYQFDYLPGEAAGLTSRVDADANNGWTLELREKFGSVHWFANPSTDYWRADPAHLFWDIEPGDWRFFPGQRAIRRQDYEVRLIGFSGDSIAQFASLDLVLDVPDLAETVEDYALPVDGARLPLVGNYRSIKSVTAILQDDGGNAITLKVKDKSTTGPFMEAFAEGGASAAALIDAEVKGVPR